MCSLHLLGIWCRSQWIYLGCLLVINKESCWVFAVFKTPLHHNRGSFFNGIGSAAGAGGLIFQFLGSFWKWGRSNLSILHGFFLPKKLVLSDPSQQGTRPERSINTPFEYRFCICLRTLLEITLGSVCRSDAPDFHKEVLKSKLLYSRRSWMTDPTKKREKLPPWTICSVLNLVETTQNNAPCRLEFFSQFPTFLANFQNYFTKKILINFNNFWSVHLFFEFLLLLCLFRINQLCFFLRTCIVVSSHPSPAWTEALEQEVERNLKTNQLVWPGYLQGDRPSIQIWWKSTAPEQHN